MSEIEDDFLDDEDEYTDLDGQRCEETETDIDEIFNPEEQEKYIYNKFETVPFSKLSKSQKAIPLERVIRRYCVSNQLKYDIQFRDLAKNKNHKKSKGSCDVDFIINDLAVIEAKNWDCFGGSQYVVTKRDLNNQVFNKFAKYSDLKKILVIANPWWERGALKYLIDKRAEVIEVGFQVTFDIAVMASAFWKIKPELDRLLYIQYFQFQKMFDYLV